MTTDPIDDFAAYVDALVRQDPGHFNLVQVAAEASRRGVFTAEEVVRCQRGATIPDWLAERLGGAPMPLVDGAATVIEAPFGPGSTSARRIDAGPVRLALYNFNRLAIGSEGLVLEMSPARGRWLAPRVAAAASVPHLPGTTVDAVVEGGPLLSHWLFDALPKLLALRGTMDFDTVDTFLFTSLQHGFHRETLERLDIDPSRCRTRQEAGAVFDADHVVWVAPMRHGFRASAHLYEAVKALFAPDRADPDAPRRIYISRSRASRRRILNEEALLPLLAARGYAVVHLEDLGIAGAAALMQNAEHVIGLHGAGFANIVFAPPGCRVSEIHGPHLSAEYRIMSQILGFEYDAFDCGTITEGVTGDFFRSNAADVVLPESHLAALLLD
ncbi:glycosyltransferase family 61 protein [Acuticoccus sediminis]|uniref:glycosyltransferase family 61 protein n=1 Tax=Acuticoccus sediminis TaxID=2184697 RepID=UPI001CFF48DF|nr:glycosyltransferase family 61 protein [Acuticoccus sediminis]